MIDLIRQRALELGFDDCRFTNASPPASAPQFREWLAEKRHGEMSYLERNAHKRVDPHLVLPGVKSIVVLAASYASAADISKNGAEVDPAAGKNPNSKSTGEIARYARHQDYHEVIAGKLKKLAALLNRLGGENSRSLWYVDTGPLLERDLAQRAGLGFVGKHTNLISRSFGNWIFISEILTTLELEPDLPEKNHCGKCSRCIMACPTKAINAPFQLDARRCISYLTIELKGPIPEELRPALGNRIYGCDDCLAICPWNKFAREGAMMRQTRREELNDANLIELLFLDEMGFKKKFAETPMLRTKRRGLLRNVCVALGNVGGQYAMARLEEVSQDPDELIAEHARWAIKQIKSRETRT